MNKFRHLWTKFNACLILLVETQIKPALTSNKDSLHTTMFKNKPATTILSNNKNELAGKIQQGCVIAVVNRNFARCATSADLDPTGLGR